MTTTFIYDFKEYLLVMGMSRVVFFLTNYIMSYLKAITTFITISNVMPAY